MADANAREMARADYLRNLARRPGDALDTWRQLNTSEQFLVITHMAMFFGQPFAKSFQELAFKGSRPNVEITVTNVARPNLSAPALQAQGFVMQSESGAMKKWLHPSGREVWLVAPPAGTPSFEPQSPQHEDDEDVLGQARQMQERFQKLEQKAGDLKRHHVSRNWTPEEYAGWRKPWWDDYAAWKKLADTFERDLDQGAIQRLPYNERSQLYQWIDDINRMARIPPEQLLEPL